jgi:hypothetical protein
MPVYELVSSEIFRNAMRLVGLREKNGRQNSMGCRFLMRVVCDILHVQGQGNKSMSFTILGTNQLKFSRNVPELNHDVCPVTGT